MRPTWIVSLFEWFVYVGSLNEALSEVFSLQWTCFFGIAIVFSDLSFFLWC